MTTALLLIAHGSRRAEANVDLEVLAQGLRHRGPYQLIRCCYLELAAPDVRSAGTQCVEAGASRVLMLPYFLSAGVHVTQDLEEIRRELAREFPKVEFHLCEPVGRHPLMTEIVAERAREADSALQADRRTADS